MWFGDFRLAHKLLGIKDMISLEHEVHAERAHFNRPFSSITVAGGASTATISELPEERWNTPLVAWLDYDGEINEDVISDLALILEKSKPNTVLIFTVNGVRNTYRVRKPGGQLMRSETSVGVVEQFLGENCTPARFEPTENQAGFFQDVRDADFPEFLAESLLTYLQHHVAHGAREENGARLTFVPLYSLCHKDGADMVTVGGVICTEIEAQIWRDCATTHPILTGEDGAVEFCKLDLIPVTLKEKITLDSCLPIPLDDPSFLDRARQEGLKLGDDELKKYKKFYRHFPVFVESSL
jgi:hypothetical protein